MIAIAIWIGRCEDVKMSVEGESEYLDSERQRPYL